MAYYSIFVYGFVKVHDEPGQSDDHRSSHFAISGTSFLAVVSCSSQERIFRFASDFSNHSPFHRSGHRSVQLMCVSSKLSELIFDFVEWVWRLRPLVACKILSSAAEGLGFVRLSDFGRIDGHLWMAGWLLFFIHLSVELALPLLWISVYLTHYPVCCEINGQENASFSNLYALLMFWGF